MRLLLLHSVKLKLTRTHAVPQRDTRLTIETSTTMFAALHRYCVSIREVTIGYAIILPRASKRQNMRPPSVRHFRQSFSAFLFQFGKPGRKGQDLNPWNVRHFVHRSPCTSFYWLLPILSTASDQVEHVPVEMRVPVGQFASIWLECITWKSQPNLHALEQ